MNRRTLFFIIIAVLVIALGFGVYIFFLSGGEETEESEQTDQQEEISLRPFVEGEYVSPALSMSGETLWFFDRQGNLFRKSLTSSGQAEEFDLPSVQGFVRAEWPVEGSNFIIEQNINGKLRYQAYDAAQQEFVPYPENIRQAHFVGGGGAIVYDWVGDDGVHTLQTADITSTNFKNIAELFRPDYKIAASDVDETVVVFTEDLEDPTAMFEVDLETGDFTTVTGEGAYQGAKFSPDGESLVFARWNSAKDALPSVNIVNLETLTVVQLDIFADIDQVSWSDDGRELIIGTNTGILSYNLNTSQQAVIEEFPTGEAQFEPVDIILNSTRGEIIFTNRKNGNIYRIEE